MTRRITKRGWKMYLLPQNWATIHIIPQAQANLKGLCWHFTNFNQSFSRQKSLSLCLSVSLSLFLAQKETMALSLLVSLFSILISTIFPQPRALQYSQHDRFAFGPNLIHSIITPTSSPTSSTSISPPQPSSLVPALFIIGDSSVDCGTNNFLATLARADHPPYGRDFDTHRPTGRFCNGRIPVDYLGNVGLYFLKTLLFGYWENEEEEN